MHLRGDHTEWAGQGRLSVCWPSTPAASERAEAHRIAAEATRRCQSPSEAIEVAAIPARLGVLDARHELFRAELLYQAARFAEAARVLSDLAEKVEFDPTA